MTSGFYEDERPGQDEADFSLREAFTRLLPLLDRHRRRLLLCLVLLLGATLLSLAWPWLIQRVIDGPLREQLARPEEARRFGEVLWIGLGVLAAQGVGLLLLYLQRIKLETVGQDAMLDLRRRLFGHILTLDVDFFDRQPVGRLMARVESDTESLRLLFTNAVVLVVGDLIMMLGIWGVLFYTHWRLALALFVLFPIVLALIYLFHRVTTHRFLEVRRRMATVTATLTEFLQGMALVQVFHRGAYARRRLFRANEHKFSEDAYVNVAVCVFFNTLFFFESIKIGLVLLLGAAWGVTAGTIVLFILLIWKEFEPIARTADQLGSFQKGLAGARRIFGLLAVAPRIHDPERPAPWRGVQRAICFEHVWFSYTGDENWVLRDVSFEIPAGQRVALAGVTGGGKSTVINLLLRFYDPQRGRITIDGTDLRAFARADLRRHFALVLQDIILFPGDIAANISLEVEGRSREEVLRAARTVQADRFIERLPQGYETEVSEKGANFSRGERQLLSFARALAVDPEVLILDEATSSVDPETERTIQASLRQLMAGRTSLIIAHRLATILDADQILVLRNGQIIERGTHVELMVCDGYYAKLFHLQFKRRNGELVHAG